MVEKMNVVNNFINDSVFLKVYRIKCHLPMPGFTSIIYAATLEVNDPFAAITSATITAFNAAPRNN